MRGERRRWHRWIDGLLVGGRNCRVLLDLELSRAKNNSHLLHILLYFYSPPRCLFITQSLSLASQDPNFNYDKASDSNFRVWRAWSSWSVWRAHIVSLAYPFTSAIPSPSWRWCSTWRPLQAALSLSHPTSGKAFLLHSAPLFTGQSLSWSVIFNLALAVPVSDSNRDFPRAPFYVLFGRLWCVSTMR